MIDIKRGQGIRIEGDPTVHAYWVDDGNPESGETQVTTACGAWGFPAQAKESEASVDCMTCLVLLPQYFQDPEKAG